MGRKVLNLTGERQLKKFLAKNLRAYREGDAEEIVSKWAKEIEYQAACGYAQIILRPWETVDGEHVRLTIEPEGFNEITAG